MLVLDAESMERVSGVARYRFEWDADKAAKNLKKHGVAFEDAATTFQDPMFITVVDDPHSR